MLQKVISLIRAFSSLLSRKRLGVFHEAYKATRFNAPFTPSYSQCGEDLSLELVLNQHIRNGFYVDIGAHDPNRFSVTRKLYDRGWTGVDVDGNGLFEKSFKEFRPRNKFIHACVGLQDMYSFCVFDEGAVSTVNRDWEEIFKDAGFKKLREEKVRGLTLRAILDDIDVPTRIDFLNIDIEGADEEALLSIDFASLPTERFPFFILLETSPPIKSALESPAVLHAISFGYEPWISLPTATLLKYPQKNI